jgi:hypothetical protein
MAESPNRRLRWGVLAAVLVIASGLLVALFSSIRRSDSVVEQTTHQLRPGMSNAEVQQTLNGVHHANVVTKGHGEYFFYGNCEWVIVKMDGDRVVKVEHLPDDANSLEGMRRIWARRLRSVFSSG